MKMAKDLRACAICGEPAVRRLQRDWWGREPFCRACVNWMAEAMAKERELLLIRAILAHGRAAWHDAVSAFFTLARIAPEIRTRREAELREILFEAARRDRAGKRALAAAARLPLRDAVLLLRQDLVRPHGSRGAKDRLTPPARTVRKTPG